MKAEEKDEKHKKDKKVLSSSSATYERYIPDELIDQILSRLPFKSQVRFQLTCKYWRSVITNPVFVKSYINNLSVTPNPPLPSFLLSQSQRRSSDNRLFSVHLRPNYDSDFDKGKFAPCTPRERNLRPLASCHGIICMISTSLGRNQVYLWNPILNECRWIGSPNDTCRDHEIRICGFGYVASTDSYKIVMATGRYNFHVYCSRSKQWRGGFCIDSDTLKFPSKVDSDPVLYNESLCWLVGKKLSYFILKFDLKNEVFDKVTIPRLNPKEENVISLRTAIGVTKDNNLCICVLCTSRFFPSCVPMWELRQGKWKKTLGIKGDRNNLGNSHKLIGLACKGEVLILENLSNKELMLIVDARQDPTSFVQVQNEYYKRDSPVSDDTRLHYLMSYDPSLMSPFSI